MAITTSLKVEGRKFGETTSIRGIPRVLKHFHNSRFLAACWLVGVLTCAGLLLWQLSKVFVHYFEYPLNTQFIQAPSNTNPTFPDISVCNVSPLIFESAMSMSYINYLAKLNESLTVSEMNRLNLSEAMGGTDDSVASTIATLFPYLATPASYFSNFDLVTAFSQYNSNPQTNGMALACNYFNWNYDFIPQNGSTVGCRMNDIAYSFYDPDYVLCYTAQPTTSRQGIVGWSGIFFIETFEDNVLASFANDMISKATGLRVAIHPPNTTPNMNAGVTIGLGTETTISLTQTQRIRQPAPYSTCTAQTKLSPRDEDPSEGSTYSQDFCYDVCIQWQYINTCGCLLPSRQSTTLQRVAINFLSCVNVSLNTLYSQLSVHGMERLICSQSLEENTTVCDAQCQPQCSELQYSPGVSSASPWPHVSQEVTFYETFIKGEPRFGTKYNQYQDVYAIAISNQTEARVMLQEVSGQGLLSSSFLQLKVQFTDRKFNQLKDVPAFTIDALGAQIGGVLSLWLGVSVMLVLETCEFIYSVVVAIWIERQQRKSGPEVGASSSNAVHPEPDDTPKDVTVFNAPASVPEETSKM